MNDFFYGVSVTIGSIIIGSIAGCYMFVRKLNIKIDNLEKKLFSKE